MCAQRAALDENSPMREALKRNRTVMRSIGHAHTRGRGPCQVRVNGCGQLQRSDTVGAVQARNYGMSDGQDVVA